MKTFQNMKFKTFQGNTLSYVSHETEHQLTQDIKLNMNSVYFKRKFCILTGICSWKLLRRRRTKFRTLFRRENSPKLLSLPFFRRLPFPISRASVSGFIGAAENTMSISSVFELTLVDDVILLVGDASGDSMSVRAELSETANGAEKERKIGLLI